LSDEHFRVFVQDLQQDFGRRPATPWIVDSPEQIKAREAVKARLSESASPGAFAPAVGREKSDPLRDALRRRIQEMSDDVWPTSE